MASSCSFTLSAFLAGTHASATKEYSLFAILTGISPFWTWMDSSSSEALRKSLCFSKRFPISFVTFSISALAASISRSVAARTLIADPVPSGTWISENPHSERMDWTLSLSSVFMNTATTLPFFLSKEVKTSASTPERAEVGSSATVPTIETMLLYPEYISRSTGMSERSSRLFFLAFSSVIL